MEWRIEMNGSIERKADVDNALAQPAGQAAAKQSKDANAFRRFATGEGWSADDHRELVENMKRIKREFPAVVSNKNNSDAIAGWLLDNKLSGLQSRLFFVQLPLSQQAFSRLNRTARKPSSLGL